MTRFQKNDWPDRLWVVRHGQSAGNVAREAAELKGLKLIDIATRDADTPLSPLGRHQAAAVARWFAAMSPSERPDVFMSSPFLRSHETSLAVTTALGVDRGSIQIDERLREREFGILDHYTRQGVESRFPELAAQRAFVGKFYFRPPGGESWCDVILRVRSILQCLRRDHAGNRVLIVAHEIIVNSFRYLLEHLDEAKLLAIDRQGDVPNCGITEFAQDPRQAVASFGLRTANLVIPLTDAGTAVTSASDTPAGPK